MRFRLGGVLNGHLSSVWISIEQSVMVSGIVYVFMGSVVRDWSPDRGPHWGIDHYRLLNYLPDLTGKCLLVSG